MKFLKLSIATLAAATFIQGCANQQDQATAAMSDSLNGQFASYSDMQTYRGNVTCGKYQTMDFWGNIDIKDFVVIGTEAINLPSKSDVAIFCSNDPKAAMKATLGIDYDSQKATIDAVVADFESLAPALLAFEKDNGYFPWTEQTLSALISPAKVGNPPRNFPEGGYIQHLPKDPWGNDYAYVCEPFAGVRILYTLGTLGADGVKGGSGENADIDSTYLKYFAHIERL